MKASKAFILSRVGASKKVILWRYMIDESWKLGAVFLPFD
jgi:hypothetical protein